MLRLLFSCLIVGVVLLYTHLKISKTSLLWWRHNLSWRKIMQMSITGIFLQGFYQLFSFTAMYEGISPGILAIILGTQPIATAIITRESLSLLRISGLILGLFGLILTVSNVFYLGENTAMGVVYCFLALLGITTGTILQKKYGSTISLNVNLFTQYLASFFFILILHLFLGSPAIEWNKPFIISLTWMVLVVSIASTYLFYYLLKKQIIVNFTSYLYFVPVVTALMDFFFFHRALPIISIIGMLMIICGLVLTFKNKSTCT